MGALDEPDLMALFGLSARDRESLTAREVANRLDAHMVQCRIDKEDIRSQLGKQDELRAEMHKENQVKFGRIERTIWTAAGIVVGVGYLVSHGKLAALLQ